MADIVKKPVEITETILRDAHQSLIATRMTTEQMLPIVDKMDKVGYHSVECWGGATFDASLRFLKEDPWERLRKFRDGFKNTKLQMLFRGQNILGYRPYADDVVEYFVQKSAANGIDIIRIFDCLNDLRNLKTAVKAANKEKVEAQIALSYTLGDAYTLDYWVDIAKKIEEMGANSICIKDMAGLLVDARTAALGASGKTAQRGSLFHMDLGHDKRVDVGTVIVLGIGNSAFESLLDDDRGLLLREGEDAEGLVHGLAANEVSNQTTLLGRQADTTDDSSSFHLLTHLLITGSMALERTRERKFAELVADHVFVDVHRNVLTAVVDGDGQTNEFRKNRRTTRPGLERTLVAARLSGFDLLHEVPVDKRAFLQRARHSRPPYLRLRRDTIMESVRLLLRVR